MDPGSGASWTTLRAEWATRVHYTKHKQSLMSNAFQISRDLWELKMGMVNAYLLETMDGLVLIDAGWPNKTNAIFRAVQDSGHDPKDIRHWFSHTATSTMQAARPRVLRTHGRTLSNA